MGIEPGVTEAIGAIANARIDPAGPGVAVAVVRGGEPLHAQGYGMANLEWGIPIASDTFFGLGSATKPFTATAIMLLEGEGKLSLRDPITWHLAGLPASYEAITVAHLLTHTSGIPNYVTQPGFWEDVAPRDYPADALPALFIGLPLDFTPGTNYSYSNSAYSLLGLLIERLSTSSYADFLRARIFAPLGMARSCYLRHDTLIPRRAAGYDKADEGYRNARYISPTLLAAGGGLGSTLDDMLRWDRALRSHALLDAPTLERMWTPVRLANGQTRGYGLGWGLSTYRGRRVAHHAGGVPGYSSFYGRFLEDDLSVIVLSNLAGFDAARLAAAISNLVLALAAPGWTPVALDAEALERVAGRYVNVIGETLEVRPDEGGLAASGTINRRFLPSSATTFYAADDPDVELRFDESRHGSLTQVTAIEPFYWFVAMRR